MSTLGNKAAIITDHVDIIVDDVELQQEVPGRCRHWVARPRD